MADRPRFRPDRASQRGTPWSLIGVLAIVTFLLVLRSLWPAPEHAAILVEVVGEVPAPGMYALDAATVHAAIEAAGGDPTDFEDGPVPPGFRLVVQDGQTTVERPRDPVLVSIPVDPNTAERHELEAIPGIGPKLAQRILDDRESNGPYRSIEGLRRVVRPDTLDRIEPFLALSDPGPVDLNTASAGELETLPGIGPVLAARIVVDRAENGRFGDVDALARIQGVGPGLLDTLRPLVETR